MKFYFTYGTTGYPFVGGWTEISAPNMDIACKLFRVMHPDETEGILNCAFVYPEEQFQKTEMAKLGHNFDNRCHERITVESGDQLAQGSAVVDSTTVDELPGVAYLEALALLHKAVDAGVLTPAGRERVYVMFEEEDGDSYWLPVTFDDAARDLVKSGASAMLQEAIEKAATGKEQEKELGFCYSEAMADVIGYLSAQDEDYFISRGRTKDEVLSDRETLDHCATEHLHCVTRFGNEREWSCKDACDSEPGIQKEKA